MPAVLRASWRWVAATPRLDLLLVAGFILVAEAEIWTSSGSCVGPFPFGLCNFGESLGPRPVEIAYTTLAALLLLGRRRHPAGVLAGLALLSAAKALLWVASPGFGYFLPLLVAGYSVGRYHRGPHPWLVLIAAGATVVVTNLIHDLRVPGAPLDGSVATFYLLALATLPVGRALQVKDLRAELSEAQVRQATLERDEAARRAVTEERSRIARELHDVVAHGVSMIVVQSVAAQGVIYADPQRARLALETIEGAARQGLDEMRRLLAVLEPNAADTALEPAPGVDALEPLVARVVAAGQPVEFHVIGTPGSLSPGLQLAVYRLVQEALTNVVKHARGAATRVSVELRDDRVEVDILNEAGGWRADSTGGGRGLIGMRERVALYGGTVHAGPTEVGGFGVHATIPTGHPS